MKAFAMCLPSLRILVVEDCPDTAESMRLLLELWGHHVWVAANGRIALAQAADIQPDVVILDIGLPGMDGFEVASRLRELEWDEFPKVIAATGFDGMPMRRIARQVGIDHFLTKPLDPALLRTLLSANCVAGEVCLSP
jgi:CheY-like chemotaxis protein